MFTHLSRFAESQLWVDKKFLKILHVGGKKKKKKDKCQKVHTQSTIWNALGYICSP